MVYNVRIILLVYYFVNLLISVNLLIFTSLLIYPYFSALNNWTYDDTMWTV